MGLSLTVVVLLLAATHAQAICPLPDPADCVYVDVATCGLCDDGVTTCRFNAECVGIGSETCTDGSVGAGTVTEVIE